MNMPKFKLLGEYLDFQPQDSYHPDKHDKSWGHELWIINTSLYCGKILVLNQGRTCSAHFHLNKDEVFYITRGRMKLHLTYKDGKQKTIDMQEGDSFHVTPGLIHQFEGIANKTHIVEFSTQHFESDSYRVKRGN